MFLSGLNNIDFGGIGFLGGDMSPEDLFKRLRAAIPQYAPGTWATVGISSGMTDSDIRKVMNSVLQKFEIRKIQISKSDADGISKAVSSIVLGADQINAVRYGGNIEVVVSGLKGDGFSLVPIGYSAQSTSQQQGQSDQPSGSGSTSIAYQGAVAAQQSGRDSQTQTPPVSSSSQSNASSSQSSFSWSNFQWPKEAKLPDIFRTGSHKQTPAEKKRLLWIVGGFGVLFVVALGVIVTRNND